MALVYVGTEADVRRVVRMINACMGIPSRGTNTGLGRHVPAPATYTTNAVGWTRAVKPRLRRNSDSAYAVEITAEMLAAASDHSVGYTTADRSWLNSQLAAATEQSIGLFRNYTDAEELADDPTSEPFDSGAAHIVTPLATMSTAVAKVDSFEPDDESVAGFADRWMPELEAMLGITARRGRVIDAGTLVVVALTSDLPEGAPSAVQTFAAQLASKSDESFALHNASGRIWIVARHINGLRHGCWRYLHALGYRWLLPHTGWRIRPSVGSHVVNVSQIYEPAFTHLRVYGNGGYGNLNVPPISNETPKQNWELWFRGNSMPLQESALGTHVGEAFNWGHQCELRADRNMLAWHDSGRGKAPGGVTFPTSCFSAGAAQISKLDCTYHGTGGSYDNPPSPPWTGLSSVQAGCTEGGAACSATPQDPANDADTTTNLNQWGFGGLVKTFAQHRRNSLAVNIQTYGNGAPITKYISCESADGGGDCRCAKCVDLLRTGPYAAYLTAEQGGQDATIADSFVHLMNETAKYIAHWFGLSYGVSYLSYSSRSQIPSIPLEPNSIVGLIPKTINDVSMTEAEWTDAWFDKRAANPLGSFKISVDGEWLLSNANLDMPRMSPREMIADVDSWIARGASGSQSQGTYGALCMGPHWWLAGRKCWGDGATETLLAEWFDQAFPVTKVPVKQCFERWWYGAGVFGNRFEITSDAVGRACDDMLDAQALLDAAPNAAEQARLDDVKRYVHYLKLYLDYLPQEAAWVAAGKPSTHAGLDAVLDPLLHHVWSIYPSSVIHSTRVAFRHWFNSPSASPIRTKWDTSNAAATGWATLTDYSSAQLQTLMTNDLAACPPVTGVSFTAFSDDLQPLSVSSLSTEVQSTQVTWENYYRLYKSGAGDISIRVRTFGLLASHVPMRCAVYQPSGAKVADVSCPFTLNTNVDTTITISGPAGVYRVVLVVKDTSALYRIVAAKNIPLVHTHPHVSYSADNTTPLYFYVPSGETKVALEYAANSAVTVRMYDSTGTEQTVTHSGRLHTCNVPAGESGKVWHMTGFYGVDVSVKPHFINCPSVFAFSREQMMVPSELLP